MLQQTIGSISILRAVVFQHSFPAAMAPKAVKSKAKAKAMAPKAPKAKAKPMKSVLKKAKSASMSDQVLIFYVTSVVLAKPTCLTEKFD